jgi:UPF0755 protein
MKPTRLIRLSVALLLVVVAAATAAAAWLWHDYQGFLRTPLNLPPAGIEYSVARGTTLRDIATELAGRGLIREALYLRLLGRDRGDASRIKAGEYALSEGLTPAMLLDLLVSGQVIEYSLTLVEGWTFEQVLETLRSHPVIVQTIDADAGPEAVMAAIGRPGEHPEGRFFPDTYLFPRGTTDVQVLGRAYEQMKHVLAEEWEARIDGLPIKTPYEALILASIVEKETGMAEERPAIAGVFIRRLHKGMLLQTDPTVIYGLGDTFDGNLRRRDLARDTAYNTYTRAGLTPTPICMPGREAIRAVLHPEDGDALYFVARGDGAHHFSSTLNEHNRAVRRYQLKQNGQ